MAAPSREFHFYFVVPTTRYPTFDVSREADLDTEPCLKNAMFWVLAMPLQSLGTNLPHHDTYTGTLSHACTDRSPHVGEFFPHCLTSLHCLSLLRPWTVLFFQLPDQPAVANLPTQKPHQCGCKSGCCQRPTALVREMQARNAVAFAHVRVQERLRYPRCHLLILRRCTRSGQGGEEEEEEEEVEDVGSADRSRHQSRRCWIAVTVLAAATVHARLSSYCPSSLLN